MNYSTKDISIIMPIYRAELYIHNSIKSILEQSFSNFELILVDDGSPDKCPSICDEFALQDKRIIVIHQENGGVSAARNAGLQKATGEYIMFVDSDDWLEHDYLKSLYDFTENHCDLVISGYTKYKSKYDVEKIGFYAATKIAKEIEDSTWGEIMRLGLLNSCWAKLYRTENVKKRLFPIDSSWGEDTAFVLSGIEQNTMIAICDITGYYYRWSETGLDRRFDLKKPNYMHMYYKELLAFYSRFSFNEQLSHQIDIKISQEFLRTIFSLRNNDHSISAEIEFLKTLFSNAEINKRFRMGCWNDDNPWFIKLLSCFPKAFVWRCFLKVMSYNS